MTSIQVAEDEATKLLESWWLAPKLYRPLPVDPFAIAKRLGLGVREVRLDADESGRILIPEDGTPIITVNSADHAHRRRFTCAHEVGHYLLHLRRGEVGRQEFVDYRATLAGLGVAADEVFANQFAAALLMPAPAIRSMLRENSSNHKMAEVFGISLQAFENRLKNLRIELR